MTALAAPLDRCAFHDPTSPDSGMRLLRSQTRFATGARAAQIAQALRSMADHLDTLDDHIDVHDLVVCPAVAVGAQTSVTAYYVV